MAGIKLKEKYAHVLEDNLTVFTLSTKDLKVLDKIISVIKDSRQDFVLEIYPDSIKEVLEELSPDDKFVIYEACCGEIWPDL